MNNKLKVLSFCVVFFLIFATNSFNTENNVLADDPPPDSPTDDNSSFSYNWTLDSRDMFSNTYKKPILEGFNTYKYRLEASEQPLNYQENGEWTPINTSLEQLPSSHPAYDLGYRVWNNKGLYNFYAKPNAQDSYPIGFSYSKDDNPVIHTLRSKLLAVGYVDSSQDYRYEVMQTVQDSQGYIEGNTGTYPGVFTGVDASWTYGNAGMKEDIILSNQTRTAIENNPPSWGWNQNTYLVFATELDYAGLTPYWNGTDWTANITLQEGDLKFRDSQGIVRFSFPIGYAYEQFNESVIQKMLYRLIQYKGNYYLLSGIKIVDLNQMTFPVVFDPTVSWSVSQSSDDCHETTDGTTYSDTATVQYIGESTKYYNSSFRFLGVNIPRNSTVTNAYLQIHASREGQFTFPAKWHHYTIHCFDEDNTTTFDTTDRPSGRNLTENKTDWDWAQAGGDIGFGNRNTADISSSVNEVVNRWNPDIGEGWNDTGNALGVTILDDSSDMRVQIHSFDYNGGSNPAELFVTYVPPWNTAPDAPDDPYPTNNTYPVDRTPTLKVNVFDDNSDNLTACWFDNTSSYGVTSASRPTENGSTWEFSVFPAEDDHYDVVNEITQNGDGDYVYVGRITSWKNDTYIMENITGRTEGINDITVYGYARDVTPSHLPFMEQNRIRFILHNGSQWSYGSNHGTNNNYALYSDTWTTNPNNGSNPWTWDDVNNMEIGVGMIGDSETQTRFTQIYMTVNYSNPGEKYFVEFHSEDAINGSDTDIYAVATNFLEPYTDYWWYVNVTDGALYNQSETFHLRTGGYSTWTMIPTDEDYNSTSPANVGIELITPSGLNSDVYIYSWNTTSNDETLLNTLTSVGNGTQTISWDCSDGTKRYYCYINTGNFTNTTNITSFYCNDVWSDEFWDAEYVNEYNNVSVESSFVNFSAYHNYSASGGNSSNTVGVSSGGDEIYSFDCGYNSRLVWINETIAYIFTSEEQTSDPRDIYYYKTTDGGGSWTKTIFVDSPGKSFGTSIWYDKWTKPSNGNMIYVAYLDKTYGRLNFKTLDISTDTIGTEVIIATVSSPIASFHGGTSICKTEDGRLWVSGMGTNPWIGYSDNDGTSWSNSEPGWGATQHYADHGSLMILPDEDIVFLHSDQSTNELNSYIYDFNTNTWSASSTILNGDDSRIAMTYDIKTNIVYLALLDKLFSADGNLSLWKLESGDGSWEWISTVHSPLRAYDVAITMQEGGDIYIFYSNATIADATDLTIYSINSTDYGETWGAYQDVDNFARDFYPMPSTSTLSKEKISVYWRESTIHLDYHVVVRNYTATETDERFAGNITSINISLPQNHYWSRFNADTTNISNVEFSIFNATDNSILLSGLDGDNNDITSLSPVYSENSTIRVYAHFTGTISMDSWNISWGILSTFIDTIVTYNNSNYPLEITATAPTGLDNVTVWYRYSPDNISWGGASVPENSSSLAGTVLSDGTTNLNQNTFNALKFNKSQWYDSVFFSYSDDNPTQLVVEQNGDYFLSFTLPSLRTDIIGQRTRLESQVFVNGVKKDVGVARSSYIRLASGHAESSDHLNVLLTGLNADDYIEIKTKGLGIYTGASYRVVASGQFTLYAENIDNTQTVFSGTATQTTDSANLNQATGYEMEWTEVREDTGYTHSDAVSPEDITLDDSGNYFVCVNIPLGGAVVRGNILGKILLNGAQIDGGQFKQGYIRNTGGILDSSIHWSGVVMGSVSDILSVSVEQESTAGTITVDGEKATIYVQKLPSTGVYYGEATQVGASSDDWNPTAKAYALWATDEIIDIDLYDHTQSTQGIIVNESGNYLLAFNGGFSSAVIRSNNKITIEVNGVPVVGAETKSNYIRQGNQNQASACLVYLLTDLSIGDNITVYTVREGAANIVNDDTPVTFMLWQKPLKIPLGSDWDVWDDASNPDLLHPWYWGFPFPYGIGYYEFYSIGNSTIETELAPDVADTIVNWSIVSITFSNEIPANESTDIDFDIQDGLTTYVDLAYENCESDLTMRFISNSTGGVYGTSSVTGSDTYSEENTNFDLPGQDYYWNLSVEYTSTGYHITNSSVYHFTTTQPSAQAFCHVEGTEYAPGEAGTIYAQILYTNGTPANVSTVLCTARYRASPTWTDQTMDYIEGSYGIYHYNFTAPLVTGVYMVGVRSTNPTSYGLGEFHVAEWVEDINDTVNDINDTVTYINTTVDDIYDMLNYINITFLPNIETKIDNCYNIVYYLNNTVWGDIVASQILTQAWEARNISDYINDTRFGAYNIVDLVNKWGSYTATDIYNSAHQAELIAGYINDTRWNTVIADDLDKWEGYTGESLYWHINATKNVTEYINNSRWATQTAQTLYDAINGINITTDFGFLNETVQYINDTRWGAYTASSLFTLSTNIFNLADDIENIVLSINETVVYGNTTGSEWYLVRLTDFGEIAPGDDYLAEITIIDKNGNMFDADSAPLIYIWDSAGNPVVVATGMTHEETGRYSYSYTTSTGQPAGQWTTLVNTTIGGNSVLNVEYWEMESAPAEVRLQVVDNTVRSIKALISITNEGNAGQEYIYYYWISRTSDGDYGDANSVDEGHSSKYVSPLYTFNTVTTLYVDEPGVYWYKVKVFWGTEVSRAGARFVTDYPPIGNLITLTDVHFIPGGILASDLWFLDIEDVPITVHTVIQFPSNYNDTFLIWITNKSVDDFIVYGIQYEGFKFSRVTIHKGEVSNFTIDIEDFSVYNAFAIIPNPGFFSGNEWWFNLLNSGIDTYARGKNMYDYEVI